MTDIRLIAGWLTDLVDLTAGTAPLADAKAKIAALTSMLAEEFPPAAFTRQSLEAVAASCKFFPTYRELKTALSAWWKEARKNQPPDTQRIGHTDSLQPHDRAQVTVWLKRRDNGQIKNIANSLDVLRLHVPAAFAYLTATDDQCQRIAAQREWLTAEQREERADSWRNITEAEVRAKVRSLDGHPQRLIWGSGLAGKLEQYAPHLLGWLPPEFLTDLPPQAA